MNLRFTEKTFWKLFLFLPLILGGVKVAGLSATTPPSEAVLPAQTQNIATPTPTSSATTSPTPTFTPTPTVKPTNTPTPTVKIVATPTPTIYIVVPPKATPTPAQGLDNDNHYINSAGNEIHSPAHANSVPDGATAICRDGTYSFSASRRGTCSHHGGVSQWL